MKLIDILVEELPKRGGWPEGVVAITQDSDKAINNYKTADGLETNEHGTWRYSSAWEGYSLLASDSPCLAPDYDTAIITRERYEAALAAKNDGWIEWGGGECPVSDNAMVDVRYRDGQIHKAQLADSYEWGHGYAHFVTTSADIIAYRLHQPQEVAQTKEDDEADLNECISQDAAPVWNGEGLPPVGCECEYSLNGGKTWWKCKIDYIVGTQGVVMLCDTFEGVQYVQFSSYGNALKFRPIRSEADRKRDEAVEAIDRYMPEFIPDTPNDYYNAKKIYDAIAAGKIPGVKLED